MVSKLNTSKPVITADLLGAIILAPEAPLMTAANIFSFLIMTPSLSQIV